MDGKEIRRRRRAIEMNQTELARRAGVPFPIISLLEHPERIDRYRRQISEALLAAERDSHLEPQAA